MLTDKCTLYCGPLRNEVRPQSNSRYPCRATLAACLTKHNVIHWDANSSAEHSPPTPSTLSLQAAWFRRSAVIQERTFSPILYAIILAFIRKGIDLWYSSKTSALPTCSLSRQAKISLGLPSCNLTDHIRGYAVDPDIFGLMRSLFASFALHMHRTFDSKPSELSPTYRCSALRLSGLLARFFETVAQLILQSRPGIQ